MGRGEGLSFPEADAPHPDCPPRWPVGHPCEWGGWPGDPALRNLATAVRASLLAPRCGRSSSFLPPCTGRETEAGADRLTGRGADGVCTWALVHVPRVPAAFRAHIAGGLGSALQGGPVCTGTPSRWRPSCDAQPLPRTGRHGAQAATLSRVCPLSVAGTAGGLAAGRTLPLVLLPAAFLLPGRGSFSLLSSVEFLSS